MVETQGSLHRVAFTGSLGHHPQPEQNLIDRIFEYCERGEVDKAAYACVRLARTIGDVYSVIVFLRELHPDRNQLEAAAYEETRHLNKEAGKFVWETTFQHWLSGRTLEFSLDPDDPDKTVLAAGVGELIKEVQQLERAIEDFRVPPGMGEFDTAAFTDRYIELRGHSRLKIRACHTVLERVRTRCAYYATRVEAQITAQEKTSDLVGGIQTEVHNYYAPRSEIVFRRIRKAAELLSSEETEDHALLLTSVRRAIHAVADYHYPPKNGRVVCHDGVTRDLGKGRYLNRLEEFCRTSFSSATSTELLLAELNYLTVFVRRIDTLASKGVHAEVSRAEARQGLLSLYSFLSNMIVKLEYEAG